MHPKLIRASYKIVMNELLSIYIVLFLCMIHDSWCLDNNNYSRVMIIRVWELLASKLMLDSNNNYRPEYKDVSLL